MMMSHSRLKPLSSYVRMSFIRIRRSMFCISTTSLVIFIAESMQCWTIASNLNTVRSMDGSCSFLLELRVSSIFSKACDKFETVDDDMPKALHTFIKINESSSDKMSLSVSINVCAMVLTTFPSHDNVGKMLPQECRHSFRMMNNFSGNGLDGHRPQPMMLFPYGQPPTVSTTTSSINLISSSVWMYDDSMWVMNWTTRFTSNSKRIFFSLNDSKLSDKLTSEAEKKINCEMRSGRWSCNTQRLYR